MKLKQKTINVTQNNLIRYTTGIPYRTHIKLVLKLLKILDIDTMFLINKCTSIKLLHRHEITKKILMTNYDNPNWWFFREINIISDLVNGNGKYVCEYPDRVRGMLIDNNFNLHEEEISITSKIDELIDKYSFRNKKDLIDLIKINNE